MTPNTPYSLRRQLVLLKAGQTTWQAGPLVKGPGLCHGTWKETAREARSLADHRPAA